MKNFENFPAEEENKELKPEEQPFEEKTETEIETEVKTETEEQRQPEFEKDLKALEQQEEEIKTQIKESGYEGILSKLSQKGRKFAGVALLSLSSFGDSFGAEIRIPEKSPISAEKDETEEQIEERIGKIFNYFIKNSNIIEMGGGFFAIDIPIAKEGSPVIIDAENRPCYKVGPKDLAEMERIRQEHFQKINLALSRRPFSARMVAEGIRNRTERALKRVIRSCEELSPGQLPEEIKKSRAEEQERIEKRKEKIKSVIEKNEENTEIETEEEERVKKILRKIEKGMEQQKMEKKEPDLIIKNREPEEDNKNK